MSVLIMSKKSLSPPKPTHTVHRPLCVAWGLWLLYRLLGVTAMTVSLTGADVLPSLWWQVLVVLPALGLTPAIIKGKSPYPLIIASLVGLIYLATAGVFLLIHLYENAPMMTIVGAVAETVLLLVINITLMMLIKRLPPMHKVRQGDLT